MLYTPKALCISTMTAGAVSLNPKEQRFKPRTIDYNFRSTIFSQRDTTPVPPSGPPFSAFCDLRRLALTLLSSYSGTSISLSTLSTPTLSSPVLTPRNTKPPACTLPISMFPKTSHEDSTVVKRRVPHALLLSYNIATIFATEAKFCVGLHPPSFFAMSVHTIGTARRYKKSAAMAACRAPGCSTDYLW